MDQEICYQYVFYYNYIRCEFYTYSSIVEDKEILDKFVTEIKKVAREIDILFGEFKMSSSKEIIAVRDRCMSHYVDMKSIVDKIIDDEVDDEEKRRQIILFPERNYQKIFSSQFMIKQ